MPDTPVARVNSVFSLSRGVWLVMMAHFRIVAGAVVLFAGFVFMLHLLSGFQFQQPQPLNLASGGSFGIPRQVDGDGDDVYLLGVGKADITGYDLSTHYFSPMNPQTIERLYCFLAAPSSSLA